MPRLYASETRVEGIVRDASGAVVAGAEVRLRCGRYQATEITNSAGNFSFANVPAESGSVSVGARGFATSERTWDISPDGKAYLEIVLAPSPVLEQVLVTAMRSESRVSETPGSSIVLDAQDLADTSALTLDDALRQVPGFSLFRRSGSRTTNPTAQGVSLRGLGASGASRALVLMDGLPLNDPFGGWVYWGRAPREAVGDVEVFRGGASNLYGSNALGGVIQLLTRRADQPGIFFESSYGNEFTPDFSLWMGGTRKGWGGSISAEAMHTDGYVQVPFPTRGIVDTPAGGAHQTVETRLERKLGQKGRFFLLGGFFDETRANGTPLQNNATQIGRAAAGAENDFGAIGSVALRLYTDVQSYDQSFSAVASSRASETLTNLQHVPAQRIGGSAQWSRAAGKHASLLAGVDAEEVEGSSEERVFTSGVFSARTVARGHQRTAGAFGEGILRVGGKWVVTAGLRWDHWTNYDAFFTRTPVAPPSTTTLTPFPTVTQSAFSPRMSALYRATQRVSLTASFYRAFRAPTLNELYRSFRVGNVLTQNNPSLTAERLTGGEVGANFMAIPKRLEARGTFFWSEIGDPIANVTLSTTPSLITRQRQNLGRTRSRGIELDLVGHIGHGFEVTGGYEYVAATVTEFPANTALVGLWVPQVPRHTVTFQARYANPALLTVAIQGRVVGSQFDDDQNQFRLGNFATTDVLASRQLAPSTEIFLAVENLFDRRYAVGLTPTPTIGPPLLARFGLRIKLGPNR